MAEYKGMKASTNELNKVTVEKNKVSKNEPTYTIEGVKYAIDPVTGVIAPSTIPTTNCLDEGSFIMFSKDNKANMGSMLGYYASAQFKNNSIEEAELFNVGMDTFESSK